VHGVINLKAKKEKKENFSNTTDVKKKYPSPFSDYTQFKYL